MSENVITKGPGLGRDHTYLVRARPHQSIVPQIPANVGRDNLAVDAIARHKVLVLTGWQGRCRLRLTRPVGRSPGHCDGYLEMQSGEERIGRN